MRLVSIKIAKPGDYLAKSILDEDERILLKEGVLLTESYLLRIERLKISSIYIKKKIEEILIDDVIKPESEIIGRNMINDAIKPYLKSTGIIGGNIIDKIRNKKDVMNGLTDIKIMDNYTYQHSVQVAIFSLVLGVQLQLNQDELYVLCIGAMMHDIGKILIPKDLILKVDPLTDEEFKTIKKHTIKGYDYLKKHLNIPDPARIIALQHHERVDGCGYPYNIKGKTISRFARIVAIADVYDTLTLDRPYRKAISPNDALEYILSKCSTQFDYEMVKEFSKAIVPYPKGTLVTLSTGDIAMVTDVFRNFGLRPQVIIIKKGTNHNSLEIGETVSLMDHLDIVIENIEFIA